MALPFLLKCIKLLTGKSIKIFGPRRPALPFPTPSSSGKRPQNLTSQKKDLITRRQLAKMLRIDRRFVAASESDEGVGFPFQKVRHHETWSVPASPSRIGGTGRAGQTEFEWTNRQIGMRGARWRTQVHPGKKGNTHGFI
jgi:hypothetical protein